MRLKFHQAGWNQPKDYQTGKNVKQVNTIIRTHLSYSQALIIVLVELTLANFY